MLITGAPLIAALLTDRRELMRPHRIFHKPAVAIAHGPVSEKSVIGSAKRS